MGERLCIDLSELAETGGKLTLIASEFDTTDTAVDVTTSAIGHTNETHELRRAVEDFASTWRLRREKIRQDVQYLADVAAAVAENFTSTDVDMANQLTQPAPVPAGTSHQQVI